MKLEKEKHCLKRVRPQVKWLLQSVATEADAMRLSFPADKDKFEPQQVGVVLWGASFHMFWLVKHHQRTYTFDSKNLDSKNLYI